RPRPQEHPERRGRSWEAHDLLVELDEGRAMPRDLGVDEHEARDPLAARERGVPRDGRSGVLGEDMGLVDGLRLQEGREAPRLAAEVEIGVRAGARLAGAGLIEEDA